MVAAALAIAFVPPAVWFTARAVEKPFQLILLSFVGYSLIGYYMFFGLFSVFQFYVILGLGVLGLNMAAGRQYSVSLQFLKQILFPMAAFLLLGALSLRIAREPAITLVYLRNYTGSLAFTFLVYQFLGNEKDLRTFFKALVLVLLANAGLGVLQAMGLSFFPATYLLPGTMSSEVDQSIAGPKPRGFYHMPFEYAKDLLFAVMPILAFMIMGYRTRWRPALFAALALGAAAIGTCEARSTQIAFVLGLLYVMFRAYQDTEKKRTVIIRSTALFAVIATALGIYIAANPYLMQRYTLGDYSMFMRIIFVTMSIAILREHWLWGIGLGNFKSVYFEYLPQIFHKVPMFSFKALQPHNVFLDIWTGGGIFMLLAYLAIFVFTFAALEQVRRRNTSRFLRILSVGFQAFLIGYLIECVFHNHIFDNNYWLLIGMSYAMLGMTPACGRERGDR